jgi:hypothetical protein
VSGGVIFRKIVADQLVYAPFSIICCFGYTSLFSGSATRILPPPHSVAHSEASIETVPVVPVPVGPSSFYSVWKEEFVFKMDKFLLSTWLADCMVWPAVSFVNFRFVPLNFRPTFVGFVQVFWQSYVSYVSHKK